MAINSQILKEIQKKCEEDKKMKNLLINLLEIELDNKGRWKEPYKQIILKYVEGDI